MEIDYLKLIASILIPFAILFLGTLIGTIRYFLKNFAEDIKTQFTKLETNIEGLEKKIDENDEKVNQVERDFMNFKADLPRVFVMKDDYIRFTGILEQRIDNLGRTVDSIKTNVGVLSGQFEAQCKDIKSLLNKIEAVDANRTDENQAGGDSQGSV